MLRPMRDAWTSEFASSAEQALELLAKHPFDVLVTDVRMPGMDGAQLLSEVRDRYPAIVRIVLSGQCDRDALFRSVRVAHQCLNKPCDADALRATVLRACALRDLLVNERLLRLVSRLKTVPSLPSLYHEVMAELESPEPSIQKVGQIIAGDAGMTAKTLQMVNAAFFGLRSHVADPARAVVLLGAETIKALVISWHIFSRFDKAAVKSFSIDALWRHCQVTSALARQLAKAERCESKLIEYSCTAGLLHDIGKLILVGYLPDGYREVVARAREQDIALYDAEHDIFGATHAEVGAYLLGLWGLPHTIVEAVAWHHRPAECPGNTFSPLTAVHAANALTHEDSTRESDRRRAAVSAEDLARLGLADRLAAWRELRSPAGLN
jgi:putative nucleotidyltransferase with HDIG domain